MYIKRNVSFPIVFAFGWKNVLIFTAIGTLAVCCYNYMECKWAAIPFLPVSLIGTATAFYIGFKNNASYDRLWEARRLWGALVNDSRYWSMTVQDYIGSISSQQKSPDEIKALHRELVYRHIAYVHALRMQLHKSQPWEHNTRWDEKFREVFHSHYTEKQFLEDLKSWVNADEYERIVGKGNFASALLFEQGRALSELRQAELINDFQHMELQRILQSFLHHQGGCERIKNYPFPRQYAYFSSLFVWSFVILLPFSLLRSFSEVSDHFTWMVIPFSVMVSWLLMTMELVGDYSENPFEGLINDIPTHALSRNIEIEMKESLGEKDLPPRLQPVNDVLF